MEDKVYILDTSALIGGFTPNLREPPQYIVPQVLEESRSLPVKLKIETAISSGQIKVRKPTEKSVKNIEKEIEKTQDQLSETDTEILALAKELKEEGKNPEIITDDYAIQNIAEIVNISFSQIAQPGIDVVYEWKKVCPGCGEVYEEDIDRCKTCGSKLKRKPEE